MKIAFLLVMFATSLAWRPYILVDAWAWFVIPALGLPPLTWPNAFWMAGAAQLFIAGGYKTEGEASKLFGAFLLAVPGLHLMLWWLS